MRLAHPPVQERPPNLSLFAPERGALAQAVPLPLPLPGAMPTPQQEAWGAVVDAAANAAQWFFHDGPWRAINKVLDAMQPPDMCPVPYANYAKAPGVPTAADGFTPAKNWDGKPVPNPNGQGVGYPDSRGRIWVPTGGGALGHGGPHWDVQKPGGGYDNVYPGGMIRAGKK